MFFGDSYSMRINVKRFEVWVRIFDYSVDVVIIFNIECESFYNYFYWLLEMYV